MLISIRKNADNCFILTEKELKEMLLSSIEKSASLSKEKICDEINYFFGQDVNFIFSQEEKELIINNCITEKMKQMEMELE